MPIEISVIIPTYNEERYISKCLETILNQTHKSYEVIVVDDGSIDNTVEVIKKFIPEGVQFYQKNRGGPASARNLGAEKAKGDILLFLDHDMYFSKSFIEDLVRPIKEKGVVGTAPIDRYIANKENRWAPLVDLLMGFDKLDLEEGPNRSNIFRAIKKDIFFSVGGFDSIGYNDDETLKRKLGTGSYAVRAKYWHYNPEDLLDIYKKMNWWARSDQCKKTFRNLLHYSLPNSIRWGIKHSFKMKNFDYLIIRVVNDLAIFNGILQTLIFRSRNIQK